METQLITREMTIGDAVREHPSTASIFLRYGLHCIGCHVAYWETLEQGARSHGMSDDDIESMVREANEAAMEAQRDRHDDNPNAKHVCGCGNPFS